MSRSVVISISQLAMKMITSSIRIRVGMSLAFGLIWTSTALGDHDVTFAPAVQYPTDNGASTCVAIGDLDGDLVPDLAVANLSDTVSVLLGNGDGTFGAAVQFAAGDGCRAVAIGDLDGDLVPDLAVANAHSDDVSVLLGVGDGTFGAAVQYAVRDWPVSVAIADLNGDQVPDLAVANSREIRLSVLLGVGDGTFGTAPQLPTIGEGHESVAIGDLDGNQVPDLAVAYIGAPPTFEGRVAVLLGDGDGSFSVAVLYNAGLEPQSVAIADVNGDQVPDLAVANGRSNDVSVLIGVGDGTFAATWHFAVDGSAKSVAIGDLDGDLVPDLAVANAAVASNQSNSVSVLIGFGNGLFAAEVHIAAGERPTSVVIGDLDGDLEPDLAVADYGGGVSVLLSQVPGACCLGTDCSIANHSDCTDFGGTFLGHDSSCDEILDTDGDGVRDQCDPCRYSNPDDTDGDGVCDSSDACPGSDDAIDSDGDGVPDDCDACDNDVPGACDFVSPILAAVPHNILKNRYISIDPRGENAFNIGDVPFDIRVRLSSTLVSGVSAVGEWWWANAPDASCISVVGPTQPITPPNWNACPTLHLTGCPIMPTSTYEIVAISGGLQSGSPMVADTQAKPSDNKWWGDAVGSFNGTFWTEPQGVINFDDVIAALATFAKPSAVFATHTSITDIHPNRPDLGGNSVHPNKLVSIDDVFSFIQAFQGDEYPGFALNGCTDP